MDCVMSEWMASDFYHPKHLLRQIGLEGITTSHDNISGNKLEPINAEMLMVIREETREPYKFFV